MSDHRDALEQILRLCSSGQKYTRRTQQIHDVAMRALGLTQGQRTKRHCAIFDRIGDNPAKAAFEAREATRQAKQAEQAARSAEPAAPSATAPAHAGTADGLNGGMHASIFAKVWGDAGGGDAGRIALADYAYKIGFSDRAKMSRQIDALVASFPDDAPAVVEPATPVFQWQRYAEGQPWHDLTLASFDAIGGRVVTLRLAPSAVAPRRDEACSERGAALGVGSPSRAQQVETSARGGM